MAPDNIDHTSLENQIKDIIQDLFNLMVQTAAYDNLGGSLRSRDVLSNTMTQLSSSLQALHRSASSPALTISLPPEIVTYVDQGRNPDIYTREFVELARRANQILHGKADALNDFRDILAQELSNAVPEMATDVTRALHPSPSGAQSAQQLSGADPTTQVKQEN